MVPVLQVLKKNICPYKSKVVGVHLPWVDAFEIPIDTSHLPLALSPQDLRVAGVAQVEAMAPREVLGVLALVAPAYQRGRAFRRSVRTSSEKT